MDSTTLSLYHIFSAVADAESISGAAKELFISQPAVSKSIKKLEDSLGTTLLLRNSRGVTLTHEGTLLYEYIHSAFETIAAGEESLKHINELGIGHLHIGVSSTLCKHVLLPYLKGFLELHPHIQIAIDCQSTLNTVKLLENKEIDIGLIAQLDNNRKISCIQIGHLQDIFVASPQYISSLLTREQISEKELLGTSSLILLDKKNITRRYVDKYLNKWNIDSDHAMEVSSMELLIDFVKTGLGIGCIIKQFITDELTNGQLVEIPTPAAIKERDVAFAYSASVPLTGAAKLFIEYVNSHKIKA